MPDVSSTAPAQVRTWVAIDQHKLSLVSAPCLGPPASTLTVARAREQASTTPTTSLPSWNATSRRLVAGETAGLSPL